MAADEHPLGNDQLMAKAMVFPGGDGFAALHVKLLPPLLGSVRLLIDPYASNTCDGIAAWA